MGPNDFYNAVYSTAIGLGANDVQARLAAAQASEETGFGQHMVGGNLFGIKAGSTYTGPSVTASTEEEYNGNTVRENASFRAYNSLEDSVRDYLGMIQSNFPDAWSAPTFSDAVAGLKTGVFGAYATRSAYPQHITAIDKKYGSLQYAQNPSNVPTPYGPNDQVDLTGLPNDVVPVADQNFVNSDPAFAYAQNPDNVPTPTARPNIPTGGLLTAFQANPDYNTPFDTVLTTREDDTRTGTWGLNRDVAPALIPTVETWSDMASAKPVQAPMDSVTASGLLGATPALTADAKANPMMSLAATADLGGSPGLLANAAVSGLPDIATVSSRMGLAEPDFDQSRFDGDGVSVATDFDPSRFGDPVNAAFDQSRFGPPSIDYATNTQSFSDQPAMAANLGSFPGGLMAQREVAPAAEFDQSRFGPSLVDPATNTASFVDQPAAPAQIASFADAYTAQRGPTTGLLSADFQSLVGNTERQLQDPASLAPMVAPQTAMMNVPATGLLAGNAPLAAQATVSGLPQVASVSDRMGIAEPGFDMGRFDAVSPTVTEIDASRFSTPAKTSRIGTSLPGLNDMARMDPLTGAIDPTTNTQSFMDQPSNLGSFPDAMAAQRGAPTGLLSADMQTVQGNVERQLQNPSSLAPMVAPQTAMMSVPATAGLLGVPGLEAQATVPALTAQTPAVDQTTTGSVTPGLLSPTSIAAANVPISSTMTPNRILPSQPVQQNAFVDSFPTAVANNTIEPATVNDVVAAPTLDTMQVSEQPSIASESATVEGPATTPAVEQQTQQTTRATTTTPSNTVAARTTPTQNKGLLSGLLSKEAAMLGTIGGVTMGPIGGLIGALAGQQVARNGGVSGLLSGGSFSPPTTQMAGGINNIASIYGGSQPPGTYATASNGAKITAQPGGYTTYENKYGVVEAIGPDGKISSYFGGGYDPNDPNDPESSTSSGGFLGGLFD